MWGLETIMENNARAAESWLEGNFIDEIPVLKAEEDVDTLQIPMIGDAAEHVYGEHIEQLFVDISGWGAPNEPALTQDQLKDKLRELVKEHGPVKVAMSEHGQFQGYVEVWKAS